MKQTVIRIMLAGVLSLLAALPAWAEGTVARAQFSTDVVDREPIDNIGPIVKVEYGEIQRVYFFTDLRNMSGSNVIHRWKLDGEDQADVGFDIGGDRWRVWSSKRLMPGFDGKWSVDVVQDGKVIDTRTFDYVDEG
ncbi:DUF2914 domain-containing protein [Marinomonas sp. CT5]|uniref:DUF2914 domain-containing protein n=1 Tax=Marinomonas sp. CT5 TaxID=2066133 RepID=UPI001BB09043|nr:DUF2914 domain-containing protein [Marinomonas sp. CT5]QUX97200.1 DUF2914 domain-containing protein [Marinomonas sp. CT5]